jgi:hypothetical protein
MAGKRDVQQEHPRQSGAARACLSISRGNVNMPAAHGVSNQQLTPRVAAIGA